ncbi:roadblock/LC7 domain-containing protein [Streptomyces sp. NPDC005955]|uniref:roadblock/LC7 domain-containing protein n=1 Tax=Streptomyces sp. NPDC005955 TaxID=3364738 RepID=UPI0036843AA6
MAVETDVLDELVRLRARVPQITGALAASADGLVLAQDAEGVEADGVAALTAAALGVGSRLTEATGRGPFRELLVRGADGYTATYAAGPSAVLTLLAEARVNVGRLHLEGRRCSARIGELVAAATRPPTAPGPGPGPSGPPAVHAAPGPPTQTAHRPPLPPRPVGPPRRPNGF